MSTNKTAEVILKQGELTMFNPKVRSQKDRRVFVAQAVYAYYDSEGNEYRKSFENKQGVEFNPPLTGTHKELNSLKYQWIK